RRRPPRRPPASRARRGSSPGTARGGRRRSRAPRSDESSRGGLVSPAMEHWNLTDIDAPDGTRDPVVLKQDEGGRAILIALNPGQELGDHQVKEDAWLTVVHGSVRVTAGDETVEGG